MRKTTSFFMEQIKHSLSLATFFILVSVTIYTMSEPMISRAAATANDTFTIRQEITDEISFQTTAADVTMVGSIAGLTGGQATGTTYAVVRSNSNSGFTIDIAFAGTPAAMLGENIGSASTSIRNYGGDVGGEPSYSFTASTAAQFAYSVNASSSTDVDQSFLNNGAACNISTGSTYGRCWKAPSTSNFRIINRSTSAPTGATTTLTFSVLVPASASPSVEEAFYTATATLTATNQ